MAAAEEEETVVTAFLALARAAAMLWEELREAGIPARERAMECGGGAGEPGLERPGEEEDIPGPRIPGWPAD